MGKIFGTDGIRGLANTAPMDSETMLLVGRAAAQVFRRNKGRHRILIGKDTRLSGYMLETALESGISSMGVDVLLVGPLPTPGVAFLTRSMRADAGIMISASHNSFEDNGVKFFGADGFKLPDETENEIEKLMQPGQLDKLRAQPDQVGKARRIDDAIGRYTVFLKNAVERELKFDGMKIALDLANGAAYKVAPLVYSELGATVTLTGDEPDGKNINADCGSTHPERIQKFTREQKADIGISFDGDADRVLLCDSKGELFDGDYLLAMMAFDYQARGLLSGDGVVGTSMTNLGLEVALKAKKLKLYRSDVGDRYVLAEMLARKLNLGGEQSGHLIALDHNTTGDGILSSLLIVSMLARTGKSLSEFKNVVTRFPQILENIKVSRKVPFGELPEVQKALKAAEATLGERGRVVLRYSGTESKARVMVEADNDKLCRKIADDLLDAVSKSLTN